MSDGEPQPPQNPFIRFKQHVDARIGSGFSILTGGPTGPHQDRATTSHPPGTAAQRSCPFGPEGTDPPRRPTTMLPADRSSAVRYWASWAELSPYSPHNLGGLPQPVPAGLPDGEDPGLLGFEAAFEDLLRAASGRPLTDLHRRAAWRQQPEPPLRWARRLVGLGLLQGPLPGADHPERTMAWRRPASADEWLEERRRWAAADEEEAARRIEKLREALVEHLDKEVTFNPAEMIRFAEKFVRDQIPGRDQVEEWKNEAIRKVDREVTFNPAALLRDLEKMAKDVEKGIHDELDALFDAGRGSDANDTAPQEGEKRQPAAEDDLFAAFRSPAAEADASFNTFVKAITEGSRGNGDAYPPAQAAKPQTTEIMEHDRSGGRTVTSTSQHVDMFGHVHQKTEIRKLDLHGNEVGRESWYSIRPSSEQENHVPSQSGRVEPSTSNQAQAAGTSGKSSGWFWR